MSSLQTSKAKMAGRAGFALSLKGRALRLLAQREHSRVELERKLAIYEEAPGQLAATLDELQAKDFISETRVVDSVLNRRSSRFGAARIKYELQEKGLASEAVAAAVKTLKASEFERARGLWLKKFGEPPLDAAERNKQMRFLAGRGFSSDAIRHALKAGSDD